MPVAPDLVTVDKVKYGINFTNEKAFKLTSPFSAYLPNSYGGTYVRIYGTYAPTGEGNAWLIKGTVRNVGSVNGGVPFTAICADGVWYFDNVSVAASTDMEIEITEAKNNDNNVTLPEKRLLGLRATNDPLLEE